MDGSGRQAIGPAVAFVSAWLADGGDYPPDSPASETYRYVAGLSDTEADELFVCSMPLLAKRLLELLAGVTALEPESVLRRVTSEGDLTRRDT